MSEIITYSKIREIQRMEKGKNVFYPLPKNFVEQIQTYIKEKKELLEKNKDKNNTFSQDLYNRVEYEIKNALRAIIAIFQTRQNKILKKAFLSSKTSLKIDDLGNLLDFEKEFYEKVFEMLTNYKQECIINLLEGKKPVFISVKEKSFKSKKEFPNKENQGTLIRMLENIPKFIGEKEEILGPFKKGDIVNIDEKLSSFLIKQQKAEKV